MERVLAMSSFLSFHLKHQICAAAIAFAFSANPAFAGQVDAGSPVGSAGANPDFQVEVKAGTKDKSASISVNALHVNGLFGDESEAVMNVTLSTPFDGDNDALPASLDGLANSTSLTFKASHFSSRTKDGPPSRRQTEILSIAMERCKAKAIVSRKESYDSAGSDISTDEMSKIDKAFKERIEACSPDGEGGTDAGTIVDTYATPSEQREFNSGSYARDSSVIAISGSVGYKKFNFFDGSTVAKANTSKVPWSAKLSYVGYARQSPLAYTFAVAYERAFKDADKKILCPIGTSGPNVECINGSIGQPTLDNNLLLSTGMRYRFLGSKKASNLAIAPTLTYNTNSRVFGADMPIYLVPNKDGALTGGIKIGYRSDQNKPSIGVFIGTSFGLVD
jgi:hypothetical protein